ncbi:MAG: glycoside hydrolase family 125 protein, partial [Lachnospiraceae bacterium]|nr:glycoside hydrolase family 125 protein [Lachnospiraceae bacterium]
MKDFLKQIQQQAKEEGCQDLEKIFTDCYANTLDTTIQEMEDGTVHVITGDIPAMWLRDSAAQMRPFIFWAKEDIKIREMIAGVVRRQFMYLCIDEYANAFNEQPNGACWEKDDPEQNPWVWERKFEIDSLCYPVQLAYLLWKNTGCVSQFDENFHNGVKKIFAVLRTEQFHEERSAYRFNRKNDFFKDTLSREGKGALVKSGTGLVWSGFRPSDDACTYGYLIPSNM